MLLPVVRGHQRLRDTRGVTGLEVVVALEHEAASCSASLVLGLFPSQGAERSP